MGRLLEEQIVNQGFLPLLVFVGRFDWTGPNCMVGIKDVFRAFFPEDCNIFDLISTLL